MHPFIIMVLAGVLSLANPGVLERVEINRLQNGDGIGIAGPGVMRIALEDCRYLGMRGYLVVEDMGTYPAFVVDCQSDVDRAIRPMSASGLLADVSDPALVHRRATFIGGWYGSESDRRRSQEARYPEWRAFPD